MLQHFNNDDKGFKRVVGFDFETLTTRYWSKDIERVGVHWSLERKIETLFQSKIVSPSSRHHTSIEQRRSLWTRVP